MNKLCINYDNNIIMYMYKNLEREVMLIALLLTLNFYGNQYKQIQLFKILAPLE